MGFYVNPPTGTKEMFLTSEGILVSRNLKWNDVPKGYLPVVLVNNGFFTAAGIAYNEQELAVFTDPTDRRPKTIYLVKIEKLLEVSGPDFQSYALEHNLA